MFNMFNRHALPCSILSLTFVLGLGCSKETSSSDVDSASKNVAEKVTTLTIYSGRKESLVKELLQKFEKKTSIKLKVRYGKTAELTALLLEEGKASPAALFLAQDAGALGALEKAGALKKLPHNVVAKVPAAYRSPTGAWVGVSGRARTLVYNSNKLKKEEVPNSIFDLTDAKWKGRLGWAPSNGSFQAFVTAMRVKVGEEKTKQWLVDMLKNEPKVYPKNTPIVRAAADGEIDVGLVNHYYLFRFKKDDPNFPAENHYTKANDPGSLVNVSGVGVLAAAKPAVQKAAEQLADFMLSTEAQTYFAEKTYEIPLVTGMKAPKGTPSLDERTALDIDLAKLNDLEGTLKLLKATKALH